MDSESWFKGYETGVMLHHHIRDGTPVTLTSSPLASMSVTGIAADMEWYADLSGVSALTLLSASYSGNVSAAYSYDGKTYTPFMPMADLLAVNPTTLFSGVRARQPLLYFRFHLADTDANLTAFHLYGVPAPEGGV